MNALDFVSNNTAHYSTRRNAKAPKAIINKVFER